MVPMNGIRPPIRRNTSAVLLKACCSATRMGDLLSGALVEKRAAKVSFSQTQDAVAQGAGAAVCSKLLGCSVHETREKLAIPFPAGHSGTISGRLLVQG